MRSCFHPELANRACRVLRREGFTEEEIESKQKAIRESVGGEIGSDPEQQRSQLRKIVAMVDRLFFDDCVGDAFVAFKSAKSCRQVRLVPCVPESAAKKGVAGVTTLSDTQLKIEIDFDTIMGINTAASAVGSVRCKARINCLIKLVCHEMIHAFLFFFCEPTVRRQSQHGPLFMKLLRRLLKQTTADHSLLAPRRPSG